MKTYVLLIVLILTTSACRTPILRTTSFPGSLYAKTQLNSPFTSPRIGVPYYLPKALVPITITLESPAKEDAKSSPSKGIESTSVAKGDTTIIINPPPKDEAPSSPPQTGTLTTPPLISQKVGPYKVTIGTPLIVPDTSKSFFLEYNSEAATQDVLTFGVGANQLLQSINATSTDKSGEALVTLAKIAADIAMAAAASSPSGKPPAQCPGDLKPVKIFTYLDPTLTTTVPGAKADSKPIPFSREALEKLLQENLVPLTFNSVSFDSAKEGGNQGEPGNEAMQIDDTKKTGVLFRVPEAYQLEVVFKNGECPVETLQLMVMAPSKKKVYSLDINRGALITKTTNLTVADGMLTKIEVNKPSSLLGVLNVPLDIIKAVLSAPAELLTLRIQRIKDEGAITQAQAEKLNSELNKLNNATLLQNAQRSSP